MRYGALFVVGQKSLGNYENNFQSSVCEKTGGRGGRFREHLYSSPGETSTFLSMLSARSPFSCFPYSYWHIGMTPGLRDPSLPTDAFSGRSSEKENTQIK